MVLLKGLLYSHFRIGPYINASIVFQLLGVLYPKIEEMQEKVESKEKELHNGLDILQLHCSAQSIGISIILQSQKIVLTPGPSFVITTTALMTGGAAFLMWLSERISIKGIGNGTSMLIF